MRENDELKAKGPQYHFWLYFEHYRAYVINKDGGFVEQARSNCRCMRSVLSLGTLRSKHWRRKIRHMQNSTRYQTAILGAYLTGLSLGERLGRQAARS